MTIAKGPTPNHEETIRGTSGTKYVLIEHREFTEVCRLFIDKRKKVFGRYGTLEEARERAKQENWK